MKKEDFVMEIKETEIANQLAISGEYCQPEWSEKRDAWMIKKKVTK